MQYKFSLNKDWHKTVTKWVRITEVIDHRWLALLNGVKINNSLNSNSNNSNHQARVVAANTRKRRNWSNLVTPHKMRQMTQISLFCHQSQKFPCRIFLTWSRLKMIIKKISARSSRTMMRVIRVALRPRTSSKKSRLTRWWSQCSMSTRVWCPSWSKNQMKVLHLASAKNFRNSMCTQTIHQSTQAPKCYWSIVTHLKNLKRSPWHPKTQLNLLKNKNLCNQKLTNQTRTVI